MAEGTNKDSVWLVLRTDMYICLSAKKNGLMVLPWCFFWCFLDALGRPQFRKKL